MQDGSTILISSSRTTRKSSPWLLLNAPGTFSQRAKLGYFPPVAPRISFMIRTASMKSPLRVVSSSPLASCLRPARFPATLKSWQGEPNVITSTGSISAPLILLMSPRCTISGKRRRVTAIGYGSTSLAHAGVNPHKLAASGKPPEPSNKLPILYVILACLLTARAACCARYNDPARPRACGLFRLSSRDGKFVRFGHKYVASGRSSGS